MHLKIMQKVGILKFWFGGVVEDFKPNVLINKMKKN
jgi:hypothetical protein